MVIFEAARAICNLRDVTTRELTPVRRGGGRREGERGENEGGAFNRPTPPLTRMPPPVPMLYCIS